MTERRLVAVLVVFILAVLLAAPAAAGTQETAGLSGSILRPVRYHDFHYTQRDKPMGEWQAVSVASQGDPGRNCQMSSKWGNITPAGFGQLKQTSGTACKWGGLRITVFFDGPGTANDGLTSIYSNGNYCVATSGNVNAIYCVQLPDGSIFMQRTPVTVGATMFIVSAEFVVCTNRYTTQEVVDCNHDFYDLSL